MFYAVIRFMQVHGMWVQLNKLLGDKNKPSVHLRSLGDLRNDLRIKMAATAMENPKLFTIMGNIVKGRWPNRLFENGPSCDSCEIHDQNGDMFRQCVAQVVSRVDNASGECEFLILHLLLNTFGLKLRVVPDYQLKIMENSLSHDWVPRNRMCQHFPKNLTYTNFDTIPTFKKTEIHLHTQAGHCRILCYVNPPQLAMTEHEACVDDSHQCASDEQVSGACTVRTEEYDSPAEAEAAIVKGIRNKQSYYSGDMYNKILSERAFNRNPNQAIAEHVIHEGTPRPQACFVSHRMGGYENEITDVTLYIHLLKTHDPVSKKDTYRIIEPTDDAGRGVMVTIKEALTKRALPYDNSMQSPPNQVRKRSKQSPPPTNLARRSNKPPQVRNNSKKQPPNPANQFK